MPEIKEPRRMTWHGTELVRVSDVPGLREWMWGQTMPFVADDLNPYDWAYVWDYERFIEGLPVID